MSEGKKKAKKKRSARRKPSSAAKKKTMSLRQAREEVMAKKKKKKKKTAKKKSAEKKAAESKSEESPQEEVSTEDRSPEVLAELQSRVTPVSATPPQAPTDTNLDDPSLAANKAAEAVEAKPLQTLKKPWNNDPWAVRHHMQRIGELPVNLRRRLYMAAVEDCEVSDSLYYRNYANVSLNQSELISLMAALYGKCKEDTMSAMTEFYKLFPNVQVNAIDRCIKFKDGEVVILPHNNLRAEDVDPKKVKSTVTKIRNSIVSRIEAHRNLQRHLSTHAQVHRND